MMMDNKEQFWKDKDRQVKVGQAMNLAMEYILTVDINKPDLNVASMDMGKFKAHLQERTQEFKQMIDSIQASFEVANQAVAQVPQYPAEETVQQNVQQVQSPSTSQQPTQFKL